MLTVRGMTYLVDDAPEHVVRRDLQVIRDDLHCTAVSLIGPDGGPLIAAAECALEVGLDVWIRPHLVDRRSPEVLAHLEGIGVAAEELRARHPGRVTLFVGSEFSHTVRGIVPGRWSFLRLRVIFKARLLVRRRLNRRLDVLLGRAAETARRVFRGPVGYGAASWEEVDWSRFDSVAVSLYRTGTDDAAYARRVTDLVRDNDKAVIVSEFGCGAYVDAERRGPASFRIVNWFADEPVIKGDHPRDEYTQARYLGELIDLYDETGVHGCFVFTFSMPDYPHHSDPHRDLDKAGFGIVKVPADDPTTWTPKAAFDEVAKRYGG
jgi:hypothetical protein